MTDRYLGILSDGAVSSYRLPDIDWLANRQDRHDEYGYQMQDINLLFGVLSDLCGLPDDVDVRGYVWLHDIDDDTIDAHIETAYGDDNCLTGIRFVCDKPPASGVEIIAEFDLTRRRVHFGCWRWS